MTPIAHLAATSLASNPISCFVWGFISHWLLDETCSEYRPMNMPMIIYEAIIVIAFVLYTKCWWCLLGLLPDFIEGAYIMIKGIKVWHSGELLFPFHKYKGQKIWSFKTTVTVEIILVIMALITREIIL